ncbi:TetR/AcrR family transcriptional regulator [Streptomyces fagopyri]|uniref:TetR/AcrR family transcriptional regulator n=1 Tax=Streptomyces fagopyri TaxID=2662397 RepID=UPI00340C5BFA
MSGMSATVKRPSARERILMTAGALFAAHRLRGVGVDRIIAESSVAKSTLDAHFPSRDGLAAAYLRRVDDFWRGKLRVAALAAGDDPREQLMGLSDAVSASYERPGFHNCSFISDLAAESEPGSSPYKVTVEHKRTVRAWVRELAQVARAADPDGLALQVTLLIDDTLAAGWFEQNPAIPAAAKDAARAAVERACPPAA